MLRPLALSGRPGTISLLYRTLRHASNTKSKKTKFNAIRSKPGSKTNQHEPADTIPPPPFIKIENGSFFHSYPSSADVDPANPPLLTNINFTLGARRAQWPKTRTPNISSVEIRLRQLHGPLHWAVIGPGSTAFLNVLRGQHIAVPPGSRSYPYLSSDQFSPADPKLRHPSNAIQYVGFSGEGSQATGGTRGAYLSARYESLREDTDWTVQQYLKGQTELNPLDSEALAPLSDEAFFRDVVDKLRLQDLLDMPVSNLSNGQTRRTRIAKALLAKPELLLLDEPFMGLDPATAASISSLLRNLAEHSSPRVLLSLRPQDPIPDWITNVLVVLDNEIAYSGKKTDFLKTLANPPKRKVPPLFAPGGMFSPENLSLLNAKPSQASEGNKHNAAQRTPITVTGEPIIEMDGVHVQYGDKVVLGGWEQEILGEDSRKKGLHWRVRRGQRWAILGANGSGKTTLLSVITSDHPQAYALPVRMFGRSRLPEPGKPAISIFDLQSRIGHSSPEIHAFFPRQLTVRAAIESAWADTFLAKPTLSYENDTLVDRVLEHFKPELHPHPEDIQDIDLSFMPEKFQKKILPRETIYHHKTRIPTLRPDHSIQYAESLTFGQLTVAQQRLVLFIRAVIKKQDLIILDEAFSGMPAPMREKCFALLNNGGPPETGKETEQDGKDSTDAASLPQLPYIGPEQSLLVVSHVREEIPDSVRFWMRLPSEAGDGKKLQFALGVVPEGTTLSADDRAWKTLWSTNTLAPAKIESEVEGEKSANDAEKYHYVLTRSNNPDT